jgi:hypothetical protein
MRKRAPYPELGSRNTHLSGFETEKALNKIRAQLRRSVVTKLVERAGDNRTQNRVANQSRAIPCLQQEWSDMMPYK